MKSTLFLVVSLVSCRNDTGSPATAGSASASGPASAVASAQPLASIHIEKREDRLYETDDDALLQVVLLAHAGRLPLTRDGQGYRVTAAPTGSILALAGLKADDILLALNDVPLVEPNAPLIAYPELRKKRLLKLTLRRTGQPIALFYEVHPVPDAEPDGPVRAVPHQDGPDGKATWDGIRKLGEHRYQVQESALQEILGDRLITTTMSSVPYRRGGRIVGIMIYDIEENSVGHALGLKNGDVVRRVNGMPLNDPARALKAYGKWREAKSIRLDIERKEQPLTLEYDLVEP